MIGHKQYKFTKELTNDSFNNCVACIGLVLFWKFLSVDVVLLLAEQFE